MIIQVNSWEGGAIPLTGGRRLSKMRQVEHWVSAEDEANEANRQSASLAALAVLLALIIVSLVLVRTLRSDAALQDCIMSGRTNCSLGLTIP